MPFARVARSCLPAAAVLELTYRCNHRCRFCSCPWEDPRGNFERGTELSVPEWKHCIEQLISLGVSSLSFTGGEPTLFNSLCELMEFAASLSAHHVAAVDGELVERSGPPRQVLLTNGRTLNEDILHTCERLHTHLSISLPGLASFQELTGSDTNPSTVLKWLRRAKDLGVRTTAAVAVTRINLAELGETIGAALDAGADFLLLNRFLPGGRGLSSTQELALRPDEIVDMLKTAESALQRANCKGTVGTEIPLCLTDGLESETLQVSSKCAAATQFFVVGPSGRTRVCNHSPVQLAHYTEIETLKRDPYWRRYALRELLPVACHPCPHQLRCDGGCHEAAGIVFGSLSADDPSVVSMRYPVRRLPMLDD